MTTNEVNYLNIALMLGSLGAAVVLPFEVFLFSYAVLGPLHYLTELSWLNDRKFFMPAKWLAIPIALLAFVMTLSSAKSLGLEIGSGGFEQLTRWASAWQAEVAFGALALSLVYVSTRTPRTRLGGTGLVVAATLAAHHVNALFRQSNPEWLGGAHFPTLYEIFFLIFLTTIVHVFVFTGAFVLGGALKSKSRSGIASFAAFVGCAVACFVIPGDAQASLSKCTLEAYDATSLTVSFFLSSIATDATPPTERSALYEMVYGSEQGIMVARLIAYAYTYHYLNWFSKTSIIKWHEIPRSRLVAIILIYAASLGVYASDYGLGLRWLLFLSMLHVFLEFPLNWRSFMDIGRELGLGARRG